MYNDIKRLVAANLQIPAAVGALYTAPVGKRVQIGLIVLHNTNATSENIQIFDNGATDPFKLMYITLTSNETLEFSPKLPITLEGGESLRGATTTAAKVNVKIYGREEQ